MLFQTRKMFWFSTETLLRTHWSLMSRKEIRNTLLCKYAIAFSRSTCLIRLLPLKNSRWFCKSAENNARPCISQLCIPRSIKVSGLILLGCISMWGVPETVQSAILDKSLSALADAAHCVVIVSDWRIMQQRGEHTLTPFILSERNTQPASLILFLSSFKISSEFIFYWIRFSSKPWEIFPIRLMHLKEVQETN